MIRSITRIAALICVLGLITVTASVTPGCKPARKAAKPAGVTLKVIGEAVLLRVPHPWAKVVGIALVAAGQLLIEMEDGESVVVEIDSETLEKIEQQEQVLIETGDDSYSITVEKRQ